MFLKACSNIHMIRSSLKKNNFVSWASCDAVSAHHFQHVHHKANGLKTGNVTCRWLKVFTLWSPYFIPFCINPWRSSAVCMYLWLEKAEGRLTQRGGGAITRLLKPKVYSSTHCQGDALRAWQIAPIYAVPRHRLGMHTVGFGGFWSTVSPKNLPLKKL